MALGITQTLATATHMKDQLGQNPSWPDFMRWVLTPALVNDLTEMESKQSSKNPVEYGSNISDDKTQNVVIVNDNSKVDNQVDNIDKLKTSNDTMYFML